MNYNTVVTGAVPARTIAGLVSQPTKPKLTATTLALSETERKFLLHRLADISSTVEAILHPITPTKHRPQYDRKQLVANAVALVHALRNSNHVYVIGNAQKLLLREGITGNTYFIRPVGDPRLNPAHIRIADTLRQKIADATGLRVKRFHIGPLID